MTDDKSIEVNLVICAEMLRDACSPYAPGHALDREWLARRERVIKNVEAAIARLGEAQ